METNYLFEQPKVTKFFDILHRLDRASDDKYDGRCAKEIFVRRTVAKWLKGKKLIWYKKSEQTDLFYSCYISITNISYGLGWSDDLKVFYYDYSKPVDIWNELILKHNEIISFEGSWDDSKHNELLKLFYLNLPEKEFKFKAYDLNKKTNENTFTHIVKAKTLELAYQIINNTMEEYGSKNIMITKNLVV